MRTVRILPEWSSGDFEIDFIHNELSAIRIGAIHTLTRKCRAKRRHVDAQWHEWNHGGYR